MPLFQYFGWVGSFLFAALVATNWCCSAPVAAMPSDVPLDQKINIRIHSDRKWPERVVFDTTRSRLTPEATVDSEMNIGAGETFAQPERQPFDALAQWRLSPSGRVFYRPAPLVRLRSGSPRQLRKARPFNIAHARR